MARRCCVGHASRTCAPSPISRSSSAGGTRVTITEEGEIYNPVFRCLMKYVIGETRSIEAVLAALDKGLSR